MVSWVVSIGGDLDVKCNMLNINDIAIDGWSKMNTYVVLKC